jgi:nitrogen fixation/metabolism regulation signal transduction histidine kinase
MKALKFIWRLITFIPLVILIITSNLFFGIALIFKWLHEKCEDIIDEYLLNTN